MKRVFLLLLLGLNGLALGADLEVKVDPVVWRLGQEVHFVVTMANNTAKDESILVCELPQMVMEQGKERWVSGEAGDVKRKVDWTEIKKLGPGEALTCRFSATLRRQRQFLVLDGYDEMDFWDWEVAFTNKGAYRVSFVVDCSKLPWPANLLDAGLKRSLWKGRMVTRTQTITVE